MAELTRLRTRGPDEVETTWQRYATGSSLQRVDPRRFEFTWNSAAIDGFSLVDYELTATAHASLEGEDQLIAFRLLAPEGSLETGGTRTDASLPWLDADTPSQVRWEGRGTVRAFIFDREYATTVARQLVGDDALVLRGLNVSPRTRALGAQWERSFQYVACGLLGDNAGDVFLEAELRRHALLSTLSTFATTFSEAFERSAQRSAAPRTVRRAVAFIEEHALEPVSPEDIARAAGISTRALQYAFRRALGVTPTQYLRRVRLAGAHAELRTGPPQAVSEIARRWGFGSASRFAQYYRAEYGQNPGQTARSY